MGAVPVPVGILSLCIPGIPLHVGLACSCSNNRLFRARALVCAWLRKAEVICHGYHDRRRRCAYRSADRVSVRDLAAAGEILK